MRALIRAIRFYNDARETRLQGPNADEVIAIMTQ
jgi:hypothetical protein